MATVFITFFLITLFYVYKMDDDSAERARNISQQNKRWSMNSQRLEEIVAELMRPISDVRRSFDTDLSALLEEYLTEAGLHALDAEEEGAITPIPNFAELALLLQQSASIYSRKVDFLYQHVLSVSDSLHQSTQEMHSEGVVENVEATPSTRRKRRASVAFGFSELTLEPGGSTRREASLRPPPTLPRLYCELAPRVPAAGDAPLCDYEGEPVGLLPDFHVTWRLREGFLVEELSNVASGSAELRPLPLDELSAAIAAAAPRSPTPRPPSPPPSPFLHSPSGTPSLTPLPDSFTPLPDSLPNPEANSTPLPLVKKERKRRKEGSLDDISDICCPLKLSEEARLRLQKEHEFSLPQTWVRRELQRRSDALLSIRRKLRQTDDSAEGFAGWSRSEGALATQLAVTTRRAEESDDDGFFEQSSSGDSDGSRTDDCCTTSLRPEWSTWREGVVARAAENEARGRDVQQAAATLLSAAPLATESSVPFQKLLATTARHPAQVSELFLATLFLANAGNIEIIQGEPLTVDSFSVRLLNTDQRLYRAALAEPQPQPQR